MVVTFHPERCTVGRVGDYDRSPPVPLKRVFLTDLHFFLAAPHCPFYNFGLLYLYINIAYLATSLLRRR